MLQHYHYSNIYSPCKDCKERDRACWDRCERYKKFKKKLAEAKRNREIDKLNSENRFYEADYRKKKI